MDKMNSKQLQNIEEQLEKLVKMNSECKILIEATNARILEVLNSFNEELQDTVV